MDFLSELLNEYALTDNWMPFIFVGVNKNELFNTNLE